MTLSAHRSKATVPLHMAAAVMCAIAAAVPVPTLGAELRVARQGDPVVEPTADVIAEWTAENTSDRPRRLDLRWSLRLNSQFDDTPAPDPELGTDHAVGATSRITIEGQQFGDAMLTDGDFYTAFETPWGRGYGDAIVDIELDDLRDIREMRWVAADANWIWLVDVSSSLDGETYEPIASLQNFDLHKKWSTQSFPLDAPLKAKHLRFRFHHPDARPNVIRLPASLEIYDGTGNDQSEPPSSGPQIAEGVIPVTLEPGEQKRVVLPRPAASWQPGSYLLSWFDAATGPETASWGPLFVLPTTKTDPDASRRFGINSSQPDYAELMRRCGFGWVRFENAKWMMYSTAPDHYAFDGSIAPWHVNQDAIYENYHRLGMRVLPYVFQTPEWANSAGPEVTVNRPGHPPVKASDYGDAVFQLVARFGDQQHPAEVLKTADRKSGLDRIDAVELWNEPNLVGPSWAPFVGPLERYFEVMRAGAEASRRADPHLPVSSPGWAGISVATVDKMRTHRYADGTTPLDLVDIINVHFYSGRQEPEVAAEDLNLPDGASDVVRAFPQQVDALVKWRDTHKPQAKIWLTETGNDVGGPIGLSERKQAAKLPRVMMLALSRGIDQVFLYRESGSTTSQHAGAGLLRNDGSLRPSFLTTATLIRQLQGFDGPAQRIATEDDNVWMIGWQDDRRCILAAWTIGEATEIPIDWQTLLREGDVLRVVDAFGCEPSGGAVDSFPPPVLGEFPVYVHLRPESSRVRSLLNRN